LIKQNKLTNRGFAALCQKNKAAFFFSEKEFAAPSINSGQTKKNKSTE